MDYKLGFYIHLPYSCGFPSHENRILLTFANNHLEFKLFKPSLIKLGYYSDMTYYSFDYPVLYLEDQYGDIEEITFLSEIPFKFANESHYDDKEITLPFWVKDTMYNPCEKLRLTIGSKEYSYGIHPTININGQDIVKFDNASYEQVKYGKIPQNKDFYSNLFSRAVITCYVLKSFIKQIKEDSYQLGYFKPKFNNAKSDFYSQCINEAKQYIDSICIVDILHDLSIEVKEFFIHKRGDNDTYCVDRIASVSSPVANKDSYLRELIGLGTREIYSRSAYCTAESMKLNDFVIGVYSGDHLEAEKQKIISQYSKADHLGRILATTFSRLMGSQYLLPVFERALDAYNQILMDCFHLDVISNEDRKFQQHYYDLQSTYASNPQRTITELNSLIYEKTTCSISGIHLERLKDKGLTHLN